MAEVPKIQDLKQVVEEHLQGATLESYTSKYLTKPGDNYGSVMLAISAQIRKSGTLQELPLIAKLPPVTNDLYWAIFQPERTCITENAVYKYLAPALETLQLQAGIRPTELFDGFSRYYGSRISLNADSKTVDRDAVLVQENLVVRGYQPGVRHKAYDLPHTVLILHYLAQYHALPIALRKLKPKVYEQSIRPYFRKFNMNGNINADDLDKMNKENVQDIQAIATEDVVNRFKELLELYAKFQAGPELEDGPFTTLVHEDMWINNMMVKYDETGAPSKLKIVDFQVAEHESLVHDLIFFLLSSVDTAVLEENYYNFLRIYYDAFIRTLERVHADTKEYSYEGFLAEVKRVALIQVPHAIFMTKVIKADNSTMPSEYKDMNFEVLSKNQGNLTIRQRLDEILRLAQKFDFFF